MELHIRIIILMGNRWESGTVASAVMRMRKRYAIEAFGLREGASEDEAKSEDQV